MAERITAGGFESAVSEKGITVIVDFYSDSCIPCKMILPILTETEAELRGRLRVYKANTAYEQELCHKYEIKSTPTLLIFRDGKEQGRMTGAFKKEALLKELGINA